MQDDMSFRKEAFQLKKTVQDLEKVRLREEEKNAKMTREVQKLRTQLAQAEKELKSLRVRHSAQNGGAQMFRGNNPRSPTRSPRRGGNYPWEETDCSNHQENLKIIRELQKQTEEMKRTIACQEQDLHRAAGEIEVLACALEEKAENLGIDGNLNSGLLYQVGLMEKEVRERERKLSESESLNQKLKKEIKHMRSTISNLKSQLEEEKHQGQELLQDRAVILEYLQENKKEATDRRDELARIQRQYDELEAKYKAVISAEQGTQLELEDMKTQLQTVFSSSLKVGKDAYISDDEEPSLSPDVNQVGDPVFERLLRETEAEIQVGALSQEKSRMAEELQAHKDRIGRLEGSLTIEREKVVSLKAQLNEMLQNKSELLGKIEFLEDQVSSSLPSSHHPIEESKMKHPNANDTDPDLVFKNERLQKLLKMANEAREVAEREAIRLEHENSNLRRQLRQKQEG